MDKKRKSILVWILTWAGLLLAVLYSPVGSPDLYSPMHYYSANQGVDFTGAAIPNAPKGSASGDNSSQFNMPADGDLKINSSSPSGVSSDIGGRSVSSVGSSSLSSRNNSGGSSSGSSMSGMGTFSGKSSKSGVSSQSTGMASLSTDLTGTSDNSGNKQSVGYTPGSGATDPGDDPTGDPIPVGDGWIFLLVLASVYGVWKGAKYRHSTIN